jgi:signal transduction histidine kinase
MSEPGTPPLAVLGAIALEVAHELRNLLLVADARTHLARSDPDASASHLDVVERSIRAARAVIDDVFALAQGPSASIAREDVALTEVVASARRELEEGGGRGSGGGTGAAKVQWIDAFEGVRVWAHDRLLARVFKLLYENAIQVRAPEAVRIETRATLERGAIVIEIEDDGPGVPAGMAERIFEPLVTSRGGGTGMGLPLARRLADAHGGSLRLVTGPDAAASPRSNARGACFRLVLPAPA